MSVKIASGARRSNCCKTVNLLLYLFGFSEIVGINGNLKLFVCVPGQQSLVMGPFLNSRRLGFVEEPREESRINDNENDRQETE